MGFSDWIYTVAVAAVICSFALLLTPSKSFTKSIELVCALSFLLTVITPIKALTKKLPDFIKNEGEVIFGDINEYNELSNSLLENKSKENIEKQIVSIIVQKTGIDNFDTKFELLFTDSGVIESVKLVCYSKNPAAFAVLDIKKEQIEGYLEKLLVCEVDIEVE